MWLTSSRRHVLDRHKSAPVPRERRSFIGLRQLQRLPRCAPCQGTYLGCAATPCIHLHLTQRASRDLISASLSYSKNSFPQPSTRCVSTPAICSDFHTAVATVS